MATTNNNNTLKLLSFICPPLAVYLKYKESKNSMEMVFAAIIFTLIFWIPGTNHGNNSIRDFFILGVIFAYWTTCSTTTEELNIKTVQIITTPPPITLHNPTPIHPKANQIISFPTNLTSVVIHFPDDSNSNDTIENNIFYHHKTCMV